MLNMSFDNLTIFKSALGRAFVVILCVEGSFSKGSITATTTASSGRKPYFTQYNFFWWLCINIQLSKVSPMWSTAYAVTGGQCCCCNRHMARQPPKADILHVV